MTFVFQCHNVMEQFDITYAIKGKKTGLLAQSNATWVLNNVIWPQERLGPEYVSLCSGKIQYKYLYFTLFCAGEMEVLTSNEIAETARRERSQLLKDIIYNYFHYEWSTVLRLYAAILTEIESHFSVWGDDTTSLEQNILMPYPKKVSMNANSGKAEKLSNLKKYDEGKVWFCGPYNRNNCAYRELHLIKFNDKTFVVQNICASCWKKDRKKLFHKEKKSWLST